MDESNRPMQAAAAALARQAVSELQRLYPIAFDERSPPQLRLLSCDLTMAHFEVTGVALTRNTRLYTAHWLLNGRPGVVNALFWVGHPAAELELTNAQGLWPTGALHAERTLA